MPPFWLDETIVGTGVHPFKLPSIVDSGLKYTPSVQTIGTELLYRVSSKDGNVTCPVVLGVTQGIRFMAKKKRTSARKAGKLLALDASTDKARELVGTVEAAEILGLKPTYVRELARKSEIWSDTRFGERCPIYDAVELREKAAKIAAVRAAGKRPGRPPSGGPKA